MTDGIRPSKNAVAGLEQKPHSITFKVRTISSSSTKKNTGETRKRAERDVYSCSCKVVIIIVLAMKQSEASEVAAGIPAALHNYARHYVFH